MESQRGLFMLGGPAVLIDQQAASMAPIYSILIYIFFIYVFSISLFLFLFMTLGLMGFFTSIDHRIQQKISGGASPQPLINCPGPPSPSGLPASGPRRQEPHRHPPPQRGRDPRRLCSLIRSPQQASPSGAGARQSGIQAVGAAPDSVCECGDIAVVDPDPKLHPNLGPAARSSSSSCTSTSTPDARLRAA